MTLFTDIGQCPIVPRNRFRPRPGGNNMSVSVNCPPGMSFPMPPFPPSGGGQRPPDLRELFAPLNIVTPLQFGAKGNGGTNDQAAIQRAIDEVEGVSGGIVYFPPNYAFAIDGPLTINRSGITLQGAKGIGPGGTAVQNGSRIIPLGSPDYNIINVNGPNCAIRDLSIVPQTPASNGAAIYWQGGNIAAITGPLIENIWLAQVFDVIYVWGTTGLVVNRLAVNSSFGNNLITLGSAGVSRIINSWFSVTNTSTALASRTLLTINGATANFFIANNFFGLVAGGMIALNNPLTTAGIIHDNIFTGVTSAGQVTAGGATLHHNIPTLINNA